MKSSLTADSRWDQALEFGSDTLRVYHPDYKRLLKVDADRACFYTDPDARAWVEDSLNHCLAQRLSVVFDSTLSRPPHRRVHRDAVPSGRLPTGGRLRRRPGSPEPAGRRDALPRVGRRA